MKITEKRAWQALEMLFDRAYSRKELAERLGVSQMTAGRHADRLLNIGIVSERIQTKGRGRPERILFAEPRWQYWIIWWDGVDCEAVCVRGNGEVLHRIAEPCEGGMEPWDQIADFLGRLRMTRHLLRRLEEPRAIALILNGNTIDMILPKGEIDLVIKEENREIGDVCRKLTQRILQKSFK